jgi:hypothetical protein
MKGFFKKPHLRLEIVEIFFPSVDDLEQAKYTIMEAFGPHPRLRVFF